MKKVSQRLKPQINTNDSNNDHTLLSQDQLIELSKLVKPRTKLLLLGPPKSGKKTFLSRLFFQIGSFDRKTMQKCTVLNAKKESLSSVLKSTKTKWYDFETFSNSYSSTIIDFPLGIFTTNASSRDNFLKHSSLFQVMNTAIFTIDCLNPLEGLDEISSILQLMNGLSISSYMFAITKVDEIEWDENKFINLVNSIQSFLKESCGIIEKSKFIPISGLKGTNLTSISQEKLSQWYKSDTLLGKIDKEADTNHGTWNFLLNLPLSLTISHITPLPENQSHIYCSIHSGMLQDSQKLYVGTGRLETQITGTEGVQLFYVNQKRTEQ